MEDLKIFLNDPESPYYTNSCLPGAEYQGDFLKLTVCGDHLTRYCNGGVVVHYYSPDIPSKKSFENFLKKVCKTRIPYFTITRVVSYCHHCDKSFLEGNLDNCPECGNSLDKITRVVGYARPVSNWNVGKKKEWEKREFIRF